ncbi:DNA polymerase I [Dorea sp. AF36-15AT]|uniref:DNA polymerase I n=1 Tax=Dorea sp. AF36-15AT TaxID=2292041 RepID=UPI000E51F53E|nr:DNA polymerase I [Dorea sp. AF36-15AT]RHP11052.1 DNA polymerase I [Dorea sp. AF36-15AT]
MAEKIVLIDGHSILNRAFYGVPDLTNADGLHTNAVYGFLNIMFKILDQEKPEYLTVAFDVHAPTFRHEMFEEYKGTRKPMAEELRQQVPVIKEVLQAMGVKIIEKAGLEADDILGTISRMSERRGLEVSVISGDRDLLQLATEHVKIRIPKTKKGQTEIEDYYAEDVLNVYQVTPTEFIDLKALMGDTSDNIPGLPGVGEKTATKIITEYHSIENAHEHASELKPPRASKAIIEHWDLAVLSKTLATIKLDAEIDYEFADAKLGNLYTDEAYVYFQKLQFKNLLGRFETSELSNKIEDAFETITNKEKAEQIFTDAAKAERVGIALCKNTEDVLPLFADLAEFAGIALCCSDEHVYYIKTGNDISSAWLKEQTVQLVEKNECCIFFDVKNAMGELGSLPVSHCFDGTIAAYLLNPLKSDYTGEDVARERLNLLMEDKLPDDSKACYEAYTGWKAAPILQEQLTENNMWKLFVDVEMPLVETLYDMEQCGVRVEADELKAYGEKLGVRIHELEQEIYEEAGEIFNINSPKQLGVILFEKMGLQGGRKTKTGYSTAADVLEKLAPEYPIVAKILEYRQMAKLKSTYADGLAGFIQADGRIHGKFHQTITATGRLSSAEPNLQNIPVRMELGRLIRKVFIPEDGFVFVDADYSQIELRILAHCSGDDMLINAYRQAQDIHRITASQVFHVPFDEVTDLQRRNAKAVNFGIVYGISSFGLSQDLSISRKEAAEYIDQYFLTYPGIKTFLDNTVASAREHGYVETLFGRRRPMPELKSSNYMQRSFGERVAMNAPIQGTAADIIKVAMIGVSRRLKEKQMKSRLVLQVHDELLIETYIPELEQVEEILKEEMERAADLKVPLLVDMHTGNNWYEAK